MDVFHCDQFALPLPAGHRFPITKYRSLRRAIEGGNLAPRVNLRVPAAAIDEQILRVHSEPYLDRLVQGRLTKEETRVLGFPWSRELVERSRRSVGGTIGACRSALKAGAAISLAGGTHHAFAERGAGFCALNDVAVASRAVQAESAVERVLVLDCDVHHGDGTAAIFARDPTVFTFSIHGRNNYPLRKPPGDLDIPLEDRAGDDEYLDALRGGLAEAVDARRFDLAIYVAGVDPYSGDRLGRLDLSAAGLERRDRLVLETLERRGLPVAVVMGGGYARDVEKIVELHYSTVRIAVDLFSPATEELVDRPPAVGDRSSEGLAASSSSRRDPLHKSAR